MRREHRKNRTRIGPHPAQPWAAERPVISVLEFGYVRRSEITQRRFVVLGLRCRVRAVAGLPVHHYRAEDAVAEAYANAAKIVMRS